MLEENLAVLSIPRVKPVYKRPLMGTWKYALYEQLPFIYRLKLYALSIFREYEVALSKQ